MLDKDTLAAVAASSYAAAHELLSGAAADMAEAARAAKAGEINLAVGTAHAAEQAIKSASALLAAIHAIRAN